MHGASTKQRLSAIRRRLGIFTGAPRWARERRRHREAAAALGAAETADDVRPRPAPPVRFATPVAWVSDSMVLQATPASGRAHAVEPLDEAVDEGTTEVDGRAPWSGPVRRRGPALLAAFALIAGLLAVFAVLRGSPSTAGAAPSAPRALAAPPAAVEPPAVPPALAVATATSAPIAEAAGLAELEVRPGDTLWDLAARHLGDPFAWPRLHDANRDQIRDPDLIHPGQRLKLPAR